MARDTVNLLGLETPGYIPPDLWQPNSPDLNPVDWKTWRIIQDRVYVRKITCVDEFKQRISDEWDEIDQQLIESAIKQKKNICARLIDDFDAEKYCDQNCLEPTWQCRKSALTSLAQRITNK